ncbi:MAG: M1 family metallopeptidase [Planctomycetales bacterium]|nr:M1 family metallopeptidase [Planctomycetales bacterium]
MKPAPAVVLSCLLLLSAVPAAAVEEFHVCRYCAGRDCERAGLAADTGAGPQRNYAPPRYVDMLHLKLDVTPNFQQRTVAGTATLEFAPVGKPLSELRLDAVHLDIRDLRSTAPVADYTATADELIITFAAPIAVGQRTAIDIDYQAEPRQGLYFRTPELGYPAEDTHLYTQGEPQQASHWFPCHDYPNERFSSEVICHVPPDMTVLSNGVLVSDEVDARAGTKTVHWRQAKPHVAYLITLAAGYFDKLEDTSLDVPLAFYSQPTIRQHAANSFRDTAEIMRFYNQEIGVPYPWDKYYQVTVRDFRAGGMENTSMTTLAHRTVFSADSENIRSGWVRTLDSHEMAHQWFGDYVTCKDWSHLWLNEGFATYYSRLYEEHRFGRDALLYQMYQDATDRVLPRHQDRRPIVFNKYQDPYDQFDFRAYPKGSWVLHMLRSQLGEQLYRDCIRTYLEQHALKSVTTADLAKVIEDVSGRSFDRFFDQWVYHARHPSLKVTYEWLAESKLAHVTVEQTQKIDDEVLLFEFPTSLQYVVAGQLVHQPIAIDSAKHDFYVALASEPTQVRFDPQYTVLADVEFKKSDKLLLAQLENKQDLIGRLLAIQQLGKRKTIAAVEAIGSALNNDPFFGARIEAAKALAETGRSEALEQLAQALAVDDARVRQHVVESIGSFQRPRAKELLLQVTRQERNPAVVGSAIRSLGKHREADAEQAVATMLESNSFRNELVDAAIDALGKNEDPSQRAAIMNTLRARGDELTSGGMANGLRVLAKTSQGLEADAAGRVEVEQFLREYVEHPKTPIRLAAIESLGTLADSRSVELLESLARDTSGDRTAEAASEALKKLREKKSTVPKELTELHKQVESLREASEKLRQEFDEFKAEKKQAKNEEK